MNFFKILLCLTFFIFLNLADQECPFSMKSSLTPEAFKLMECTYINDKWKPLSIKQNEIVIAKIHGDIMEDYKETLKMFDPSTNELNLPSHFSKESIDILVKFLYLKQIDSLLLPEVFPLLKVAFHMKITPVITEIAQYLRTQINSSENSLLILRECMEIWVIFPDFSENIVTHIISDSLNFIVKNKEHENLITTLKNDEILNKMNSSQIERVFNFFIGELRKMKAKNLVVTEFLLLFKEPLIQKFRKIDSSFSIEKYYRKIIEQNFDVWDLDVKNVEDFLIKAHIYEGFEMKEFLLTIMGLNIKENAKNIQEMMEIIKNLEKRIRQLEGNDNSEKNNENNQISSLNSTTEDNSTLVSVGRSILEVKITILGVLMIIFYVFGF